MFLKRLKTVRHFAALMLISLVAACGGVPEVDSEAIEGPLAKQAIWSQVSVREGIESGDVQDYELTFDGATSIISLEPSQRIRGFLSLNLLPDAHLKGILWRRDSFADVVRLKVEVQQGSEFILVHESLLPTSSLATSFDVALSALSDELLDTGRLLYLSLELEKGAEQPTTLGLDLSLELD